MSWLLATALTSVSLPAQTPLGEAQELSRPERYAKYPSLALDSAGRLWAAWTSTRIDEDGPRDEILARVRIDGDWSAVMRLDGGQGLESGVELQQDAQGVLWALWHGRREGRWGLYSRRLKRGDPVAEWDAERRLALDSDALHPVLSQASGGGLWMAYEKAVEGGFTVELRHLSGDRVSAAVGIPPGGTARRPHLASCPSGQTFLAWDSTAAGNYDVWLARVDSSSQPRLADVQPVTRQAVIDDSPWLSCAPDGSLWVAFNSMRGRQDAALRTDRHSGDAFVRVLREGRWLAPAGVDPQAQPGQVSFGMTVKTPRDAVDPYWHWKQTQNYPRVFHHGQGAWIIWRSDATGAHDFDLLARYHDGRRWSPEYNLTAFSPGRDEWPSALVDAEGRLQLAWEGQLLPTPQRQGQLGGGDVDAYNTKGNANSVLIAALDPPAVRAAKLPAPMRPAPLEELVPVDKNEPPLPGLDGPAPRCEQGPWRIYFGDPHMHSVLSDGKTAWPDQLLELSRQDMKLDFAVVSDHAEMGLLQPAEHAELQLTSRSYDQPGRFVALSGWEWTAGVTAGHRVAVFRDDGIAPLSADRPEGDTIEELYDHLRGHDAVLSPHHTGNATWGRWNPSAHHDEELEPNFEIASWHGRFEFYGNPREGRRQVPGHQYQDALGLGRHVGVMAASDTHHLTPGEGGLTAVLAEDLSRESVFDALRNRRNYATSGAAIVLEFTLDGHPMGSIIDQSDRSEAVQMSVRVEGTAPIDRVEIVRNLIDAYAAVRVEQDPHSQEGVFVLYRHHLPQSHDRLPLDDTSLLRFTVSDPRPAAGETSYYVRVTQADGHQAWSSPIWIRR
ncbi:MAG TPA: CehA/McbA family metallohydrolase [Acidobacteriota bacterium]|nr:CehA/McbA family metallohydrolase [Acidobacteriota bacterium]